MALLMCNLTSAAMLMKKMSEFSFVQPDNTYRGNIMKMRIIPALAIGMVVLLITSLAYSSEKRKKTTTQDPAAEKKQEEEKLKDELLNALESPEQKKQSSVNTGKAEAEKSSDKKEQLKSPKN
jgi:preprotein translocase subunit SecF